MVEAPSMRQFQVSRRGMLVSFGICGPLALGAWWAWMHRTSGDDRHKANGEVAFSFRSGHEYFPQEAEGEWLSAPDFKGETVRLASARFQPMKPIPVEGYVPVEATAPTVRTTVINKTDRHIARIRIRVKAFVENGQRLMADEVTDVPGLYVLTPAAPTPASQVTMAEWLFLMLRE